MLSSEGTNNVKRSHAPQSVRGFLFRRLTTNTEIIEAQKLLYDCYILEGRWNIPTDNASKIRILESENGCELTDAFSTAAVWLGAYCGDVLIGCVRVLKTLELPLYIEIPKALSTHSTELNRLAVTQKYRHHRIVTLMLLRTACDYAASIGPVAYITAEFPDPCSMYKKMGMIRYDFEQFRYHKADPRPVEILYYDTRKHDRYSTPLYKITNKFLK